MRTIDCSLALKYTDTIVRRQLAKDQDYRSLIGPISPQTQYGEAGLITNKTIPTGIMKVECAFKCRQLVMSIDLLLCCLFMFHLLVTHSWCYWADLHIYINNDEDNHKNVISDKFNAAVVQAG